jgi:hypothetical protein
LYADDAVNHHHHHHEAADQRIMTSAGKEGKSKGNETKERKF